MWTLLKQTENDLTEHHSTWDGNKHHLESANVACGLKCLSCPDRMIQNIHKDQSTAIRSAAQYRNCCIVVLCNGK